MKTKSLLTVHTGTLLCCILIFALSGCRSQPGTSSSNPGRLTASSGPYYTGDGGKGARLAVLVPAANRLTREDDYLPVFVQGSLTGGFNRFSAITVIDRQNMDKIISEQKLSESGNFSEADYIKIGNMTNTQLILAGSITRANNGYILDLGISDAETGVRKYSFSPKTYTATEIEGGEAAASVVEELLTQMGVVLTAAGKTELHRTADKKSVDAELAMSRGIMAQKGGTTVEALNYYYQAAAFNPGLTEAVSRLSNLSSQVSSGNIGESVRNDIQRRNEWIRVTQEADAFFAANPPFELLYNAALIKGTVDYKQETVDFSFKMQVRPSEGFKVLRNMVDGLRTTRKAEEWGLSRWPFDEQKSLGNRFHTISVTAMLMDDQGKPIAQGRLVIEGIDTLSTFLGYSYVNSGWDQTGYFNKNSQTRDNVVWNVPNRGDAYLNLYTGGSNTGSIRDLHFTVKAEDITNKMTIKILSAGTANWNYQRNGEKEYKEIAPIRVLSTNEELKPESNFYY